MQAISLASEVEPVSGCATQLAKELIAVATHVFKRSSAAYFELVDELDLTSTQIRLLTTLEQASATLSLNDVARQIELSLPATSRAVDALLRRGMIERREDDCDRRIRRITIAPAGERALKRLDDARLGAMEAFVATLDESQRVALRTALASLVARCPSERSGDCSGELSCAQPAG